MAVASHLLKTQWLSGLLLSKTRDMAWRLAIGAPVRAKVNITRYVSALLPLQGANSTAHYTQGVASLAAGL